jgi:hypothetical protein
MIEDGFDVFDLGEMVIGNVCFSSSLPINIAGVC